MTSPADQSTPSPAPAAPSSEQSAPRAPSNETNQTHQTQREPIRDPAAYQAAQLEKMERLLKRQEEQRAQERARFVRSLHEQAVQGIMARAPQDEDLRAFALDFVQRTVAVDPETLEVNAGNAPSFVAKLAQMMAPATTSEQPAAPAPKNTIVHPPPEAETAPAKSSDWRVRMRQVLDEGK